MRKVPEKVHRDIALLSMLDWPGYGGTLLLDWQRTGRRRDSSRHILPQGSSQSCFPCSTNRDSNCQATNTSDGVNGVPKPLLVLRRHGSFNKAAAIGRCFSFFLGFSDYYGATGSDI